MDDLYGMQRANGDWFAISNKGQLRMTIFLSVKEAMAARSRNLGMECFKPAALDEVALEALKKSDGDKVWFCLVTEPLRKLQRGQTLDFAQITRRRVIGNEQSAGGFK